MTAYTAATEGMPGEDVPLVVGICAASDVLLMAAGVASGGIAIGDSHWLLEVARIGNALFIFGCPALAARRAWRTHLRSVSADPMPGLPTLLSGS